MRKYYRVDDAFVCITPNYLFLCNKNGESGFRPSAANDYNTLDGCDPISREDFEERLKNSFDRDLHIEETYQLECKDTSF
jgi:hypothetical protein